MIHVKFAKGDYQEQLELFNDTVSQFPDAKVYQKSLAHFTVESLEEDLLAEELRYFGYIVLT